jgi:hypothetical protein
MRWACESSRWIIRRPIHETLRFVAQSRISRSGIVFDYLTPPPRYALLRVGGFGRVVLARI